MSCDRVPLRSLGLHDSRMLSAGSENLSTSNSLATLSNSIAKVISQAKARTTLLDPDEETLAEYQTDVDECEAVLSGVEQSLSDIEAYLASERKSLGKATAFVDGCNKQKAVLDHMLANLPVHLPRAPPPLQTPKALPVPTSPSQTVPRSHQHGTPSATALTLQQQQRTVEVMKQGSAQSASLLASASDAAAGDKRAAHRKRAPRDYVSKTELDSCSSYMVGRLTQEKVNYALDELAGFAERNARVLASLRGAGPGVSLQPAERDRAFDLLHNVAKHADVRGRFWFTEADLRAGAAVKCDKTGKSILQLLRHLKRLREVRGRVQGQQEVIYVLEDVQHS